MSGFGLCHLASAIYLAFIVSLVISVNDNDQPRRVLLETARRTAKLLGGLALIGLIVYGMSLLG